VLDLKAIREDPEPYRHALARRGAAEALDRVLLLDEERRSLTVRVEALRAEQNRGSKEVAQASGEDKRELIAKLREVSAELKTLEPELARVEEELQHHASRLPNVPDPTAPDGRTEEDNVVVKEVGEKRGFDFQPLDHLALGEALGPADQPVPRAQERLSVSE